MTVSRQIMEELFEIGEIVPGTCADGIEFRVAAFGDGHVQLQPVASTDGPIVLEYGMVSAAIDAAAGTGNAPRIATPLACFVAEYLRRAEEARRDAEVEAMWLSAGVCQIQ